jgi:CRP-like cAMP-binding protein
MVTMTGRSSAPLLSRRNPNLKSFPSLDIQQQIRQSLLKIFPLTDEQIGLFLEKLHIRSFKKNEYLLEPPKVCRFTALVLKGGFRLYRRTAEKEHTLHFFTETDWVGDLESFVVQAPTVNHIQATEKAEIAIISLHDIHELMARDSMFLSFGRIMKGWSVSSNRYTSLIDDTPDARYRLLLETHPDWILRFSQTHLATYLGMSRETYSRVKRRYLSIS